MDPMLTINQFCEARYPSTRGDLPAPKHSILAIINTAQCLYNDFLTFQAHLPYSDTRSVRLFILGVKHHISNLLAPSITQLANYAFGETPGQMGLEMADLIDKAIDAVKSAQGLYTTVLNFVNISLQPLAVGSSIPAAAPRELLLTLFSDKPQIVSAISEDMEGSLQEISKYVKLMTSPRKLRVPQGISNGVPKMLFECYHEATSLTPFFIGDNEADWSDLSEVAEIRRQDRDYRLQQYIPLTKAYRALREVEHVVVQQQPLGQGPAKLDEARMEAVEQMRKDQRFLGRTSEVGQAFDANNLKAHQCCYPCQGMMGYITPAAFKPAKKGHT